MKKRLIVLAAVICVPAMAFGGVLYSSDLTDGTNWTINEKGGTNTATFGWDYSAMGIPAAPGSADTLGLYLSANDGPTATSYGGITASPTGQTFSGNYQMSFDFWSNYNGPAPAGGSGSTEYTGGGIGYDGTSVESSYEGSGARLLTVGDSSSARDWRMYKGATEQWVASNQYDVSTNNNTAPEFAAIAPAVDISQFAGQGQTGITDIGGPAFAWHHVVITVIEAAGTAHFEIDGLSLGTCDNAIGSPTNLSGGIHLTHADYYSSMSGALGFAVFDNLVVTDVPEPASLALLAIGGLALIRRR